MCNCYMLIHRAELADMKHPTGNVKKQMANDVKACSISIKHYSFQHQRDSLNRFTLTML